MSKCLKVAVLTESRSDYGIYYPLLKALDKDDRFELFLFVTGMHLLPEYGLTLNDIEFPCYTWFEYSLSCHNPDILMVLGDRRPMLEAAIESAYQNIPVVHIQGGDRTETIDESCRHAITRFAHLHFPATEEARNRLIDMGEEEWRITTVGPLGLYAMDESDFIPDIRAGLNLDDRPIILVIQHPASFYEKDAAWQYHNTLDAVNNPKWQPVIIYPNNDAGSELIIDILPLYNYKKFKSLPYLQFISLLKISSVIVGNSSCGIVEAPAFGIPVVNIGNRQKGRQYLNFYGINIDYDDDIRLAIENALKLNYIVSIPEYYYNGVDKIIDVLAHLEINEKLLQKRLTF